MHANPFILFTQLCSFRVSCELFSHNHQDNLRRHGANYRLLEYLLWETQCMYPVIKHFLGHEVCLWSYNLPKSYSCILDACIVGISRISPAPQECHVISAAVKFCLEVTMLRVFDSIPGLGTISSVITYLKFSRNYMCSYLKVLLSLINWTLFSCEFLPQICIVALAGLSGLLWVTSAWLYCSPCLDPSLLSCIF